MSRWLGVIALATAVSACGGGAAPSSPTPSLPAETVQITQQDSGRTVPVAVGQLVAFSLGDALDWTLDISDPSVLSAEPGKNTLVRGTQLLARAHKPGTVIVGGQGKPRCAPGQACAQYIALFQVTIVVR